MIMDQQYEFHIFHMCVRLCMQIYGLWRPYAGPYICVKSGALLGRAGVNFGPVAGHSWQVIVQHGPEPLSPVSRRTLGRPHGKTDSIQGCSRSIKMQDALRQDSDQMRPMDSGCKKDKEAEYQMQTL